MSTPAPVQRPPRRPDESMTLLREVVERPLDPGYAAAARRRELAAAAGEPAPPPRSRATAVTAVLALVAGLVLTSAVVQLRVPAQTADREALLERIEDRTAEADRAAEEVAALRAEVQGVQDRLLAGDPGSPEAGPGLLVASGSTPVRGPGLVLTLDDAPSLEGELVGSSDDDEGRVIYLDLQVAANGLWASGAEAVAINGQRLTSTSAIRNAGSAILVNFRPLSPPYRLEALGDPNALATELAVSPALRYLVGAQAEAGIVVSVDTEDELALPAEEGQQLFYAEAAVERDDGVARLADDPAPSDPAPDPAPEDLP